MKRDGAEQGDEGWRGLRAARAFAAAALTAALLAGCSQVTQTVLQANPAALVQPDVDENSYLVAPPVLFRVYDVAAGGEAWQAVFARRLADADIDMVILGEIHDNPEHHAIQAWLVTALNAVRPRSALLPTDLFGGVQGLAFEMIPADQEEAVNALRPWRPGAPSPGQVEASTAQIGAALDWENSGWPSWPNYGQILASAPQAYVAGGGLPRDALMGMAMAGAGTAPFAARFGLDQPLPPAEQAAREDLQFDVHCAAIPRESVGAMVAAQRIRDASFADAALRARALGRGGAGPGFTVLITGNGHARADWGVPRALAAADPELKVLTVGFVEAPAGYEFQQAPIAQAVLDAAPGAASPPFDYVVMTQTPPVRRADPCTSFR